MGLLSPALAAIAAGVLVPLALHLLHRGQGRRIAFPALRYLLRTEKDHARRIRSRQLLLLALRCGAIVLAALAAGRLVLRGAGPAHPPTAVAIILDNSLSSGRVVDDARVLDLLKTEALDALSQSGPGDLFWLIRAGEPWELATPLSGDEARAAVAETQVSGGAGDIRRALARARRLLEESALERREIHLLSDLQASAFQSVGADTDAGGELELGGIPVLVRTRAVPPGENRYIRSASLGGGLTPRANRRTTVDVAVGGPAGDTTPVSIRVILGDQLRGAAETPAEGTAVLPVGPFAQGRLEGYAETDPDDLRSDDRYYLSTVIAPPPAVAVVGDLGPFLDQALDVLASAGRLSRSDPAQADVVFLEWGQGLAGLRRDQRAIIVPGSDPALRTAATRRLRETGVDAGYAPGSGTPAAIATDGTGVGLADAEVTRLRTLAAGDTDGVRPRVLLDDGGSWLVEADTEALEGPVVILASRLDPAETTVPLEASMVPLVEWLVAGSGGGTGRTGLDAGAPITLPAEATQVEDPAGTRTPVDGTREFRFTGVPGIYSVLAGDELLDRVAVNAPLRESLLAPATDEALETLLASGDPVLAPTARDWRSSVFTQRSGREVWPWLVAGALALLLLESWVAASGGAATARRSPRIDTARVRDAKPQA